MSSTAATSRFVIFEIGITVEAFNVPLHKGRRLLKAHLSFANRPLRGCARTLDQISTVLFNIREHFGDGIAFDHVFETVATVRSNAHVNRIGIAKEVVKVTEGFLVGPNQKGPEVVRLVVGRMQSDRASDVSKVDELVYLTIAVACQIREHTLECRFLLKSMER